MKPNIPPHVAYPALHESRQHHCRASDPHGTAGLVLLTLIGFPLLCLGGGVIVFLIFSI